VLAGRQRAREEERHKPGIPAAPARLPGRGNRGHRGWTRTPSPTELSRRRAKTTSRPCRLGPAPRPGPPASSRRCLGRAGEHHGSVLACRLHRESQCAAAGRDGACRSARTPDHRAERVPVHPELGSVVGDSPAGVERSAPVRPERALEGRLDTDRRRRTEDAVPGHERTRDGCRQHTTTAPTRRYRRPRWMRTHTPLSQPGVGVSRRECGKERWATSVTARRGDGPSRPTTRSSECGVRQPTVV
jgi:hypothetical protein